MAQELEIEFKNIISAQEYQALFQAYSFSDQDKSRQRNIYYDTPDHLLKEKDAALRLRVTDHYAHVTLKQSIEENQKLETTDSISHDEANKILDNQESTAFSPEVSRVLKNLGVNSEDLYAFADFTTIRYEKELPIGLLVLDQSYFSHFTDYELELEVANHQDGQTAFQQLLEDHGISKRPAQNKIARSQLDQATYRFD
ncbi:CYTH domain-containing protein [Aerococcus kribbianus]|uniref:CYTH domain-containing protein n=1 Tax=Aerococcus kribbianus TaxID=2999064 RepID=A0A9X3JG63_9LACT|nr:MULTISPECIES: CYTH domain-containing protein [unclassified Aerococcus]MCZ0717742.1 CYTH domain-containing protein [Aerococcus sp. YH-aer221]MCZ0726030.1 CYTH domain-containing protein [Aerococcus sp. YH-aer222]